MMVFNVCVNDSVQLTSSSMNSLVEELIDWLIDRSFDSHYCWYYWLTVYYKWTKHILILQKVSKLTLSDNEMQFFIVVKLNTVKSL